MSRLCTSFCLLLAHFVMVYAYRTFDSNQPYNIQRTGIKRKIEWKQFADPVPLPSEVELFRKNILCRPGEFGPLDASRQLELELECYDVGMTYEQGACMRKQLLIKKALTNAHKLKDRKVLRRLSKAFENKRKSLLDMSLEIGMPPVSVFRAILSYRLARIYKLSKQERNRIIKSMVYGVDIEVINEFLCDDWEFLQMQTAKRNDIVGYAGHDINIPQEWEDRVLAYLNKHGINFMTENDLRESDSTSTPDCLVLDDLYINNRPIRWIEVKSFYASGLKENEFMAKKSIFKQVKRYNIEFGSGAVILKNGFSDILIAKLESTLLLDGGPLSDSSIF